MSKHSAASKPGAKLVKLKEELDREMTKKREEAWKRRIEEAKMDEEMYDGRYDVSSLDRGNIKIVLLRHSATACRERRLRTSSGTP